MKMQSPLNSLLAPFHAATEEELRLLSDGAPAEGGSKRPRSPAGLLSRSLLLPPTPEAATAGPTFLLLLVLLLAAAVAVPVDADACCRFEMTQVQQMPMTLPYSMRCSSGISAKLMSCAAGHSFQLASRAGSICTHPSSKLNRLGCLMGCGKTAIGPDSVVCLFVAPLFAGWANYYHTGNT